MRPAIDSVYAPFALPAILKRAHAHLADPRLLRIRLWFLLRLGVRVARAGCRLCWGLRPVRVEELADGLLRRLEAEVAQEERRPGGVFLRAQDLLCGFGVPGEVGLRGRGAVCVCCGGRAAVEVVTW